MSYYNVNVINGLFYFNLVDFELKCYLLLGEKHKEKNNPEFCPKGQFLCGSASCLSNRCTMERAIFVDCIWSTDQVRCTANKSCGFSLRVCNREAFFLLNGIVHLLQKYCRPGVVVVLILKSQKNVHAKWQPTKLLLQ